MQATGRQRDKAKEGGPERTAKSPQDLDERFWSEKLGGTEESRQLTPLQAEVAVKDLKPEQDLPTTEGTETEQSAAIGEERADRNGSPESKKEEQERYYRHRTYEELSIEFRSAYQNAIKKDVLVGQMYNRLTLEEQYTHKAAVDKIHDDHKDLQGFSRRNIRRNIPKDNPIAPRRRVGPRCPKKKNENPETAETLMTFTVTTHTELKVRNEKQPYIIPLIVEVNPVTRAVNADVDQAKFDEWNYPEDRNE